MRDHLGLSGLVRGPVVIGRDSLFTLDGLCMESHIRLRLRVNVCALCVGLQETLWTGHVVIDLSTGDMAQSISYAHVNFG